MGKYFGMMHKYLSGAGAATTVAKQIMAAVTPLKPGADFEIMRFDWKSAETAFVDRQMDVYIGPTTVPSPMVQQFALISKIRLIGIPDDAWDKPSLKAALSLPGRTIHTIPPNVYKNMVNTKPIKSIGSWVGLGTHKWLDADLVDKMTKALWENIGDLHATADWLKSVTMETALNEMNIPLHAGAEPVRTGVNALRLSLVGFIVPFVFIYEPSLLLVFDDFSFLAFLWVLGRLLLAIWLLSTAMSGFDGDRVGWPSRALRMVIGFAVILAYLEVQIAALVAGIAIITIDRLRARRRLGAPEG